MKQTGYIQLLRACNQQCLFCANPPQKHAPKTLAQVIEQLDELIVNGYQAVTITGGEPTLLDYLPDILHYAVTNGIAPILVSNGQRLSDPHFCNRVYETGLRSLNLSVHSHKPDIQATLTCKHDSLQHIEQTLQNTICCNDLRVQLSMVMTSYSIEHLHESIDYFAQKFPHIKVIAILNMDTIFSDRVRNNPHVIPDYMKIEEAIPKIQRVIEKHQLVCQIERVPLCLMTEVAHWSLETQKIITNTSRKHFYMDQRGRTEYKNWYYDKLPPCKNCYLNDICAGIHNSEFPGVNMDIIAPVFVDKQAIINQVENFKYG